MPTGSTGTPLSVATLNIHGGVWPSPHFRRRCHLICQTFEQLGLDLIYLQEVWSYPLLWVLRQHLPSSPSVVYGRGLFGPQAGLVTFSRWPLQVVSFTAIPPVAEPRKQVFLHRVKRAMKNKGVLVSFLPACSLLLCNVHLVANGDGDWSEENR